MASKTKNATITGTMLGREDHGIMSCWIHLDYGNCGAQGFGGYALDEPVKDGAGKFLRREGSAYGMEFIGRILAALEIETWEKLKGTPCRVVAEHNKVHAIGHFLKDKWFYPERLMAEMEKAHAD